MNTICEYDEKLRKCLFDWFNQYEWKWFVSLVYPYQNIENAENYLRQWRNALCKKHNLQDICYIGVFVNSNIEGKHFHFLMNSFYENDEIVLDTKKKNTNKKIVHRRCYIEPVDDIGIIDYIAYKNTPHNRFTVITHNPELLKKYRKLN